MSLVQGVAAQKWGELSRLYAAQTDVRHPMSHSSQPLLSREAVALHFEAAGAAVTGKLRFAAENIRIHVTSDPEVIVAEFEYRGHNIQSGTKFACPCVFVMRVRNGLISESRDYVDHAAFAAAFTK
jgi:ketosteroid isomerase-like protein